MADTYTRDHENVLVTCWNMVRDRHQAAENTNRKDLAMTLKGPDFEMPNEEVNL